jgi:acyl-CoA synthetase (AMP-forming)/AMP-acid ligase II
VSGAPSFAYELCTTRATDDELAELDLRDWAVAFCGAEAVRESALRGFEERFARAGFDGTSFAPCYGLAESTLMVTSARPRMQRQTRPLDSDSLAPSRAQSARSGFPQRVLVSSGSAVDAHEVLTVAEDGSRCHDEQIGEIWVRGPSVAQGYWQKPELSRATFQASSPSLGGPFLRTGDFGYLKDGELFVCGRLKDVIVLAGRNYAAEDIEATVATCDEAPGEHGTVAFGVDDGQAERLVLVHEVHAPLDADVACLDALERTIRTSVAESVGAAVHRVVFVRRGSIPRTTSGKVRRAPCKELWERGELTCLRSRTQAAQASSSS